VRVLIKGFERLNKRKKKMLQGYCYSSPLAQRADHPLVPSVHLGAECHFCSWLTEVKEANYWLSFPQGSCRRISLQANMDFSATRMLVMTVIFVELYERNRFFFFFLPSPPSSDLCRCLLKTTVNMLAWNGNV